jgi:hypothetical protein
LTHIEIKGDGSNSVAPPVEQNTYDGVYFEFTDGGHFMTQSFKTLRSIINTVIPICDAWIAYRKIDGLNQNLHWKLGQQAPSFGSGTA